MSPQITRNNHQLPTSNRNLQLSNISLYLRKDNNSFYLLKALSYLNDEWKEEKWTSYNHIVHDCKIAGYQNLSSKLLIKQRMNT